MSHACAIPGCERPAKDRQLMCWPHWRRVPRALNRAIFETCASGMGADYEANVAEAVRIIQEKEAAEAPKRGPSIVIDDPYADTDPDSDEGRAMRAKARAAFLEAIPARVGDVPPVIIMAKPFNG